MLAGIDSARIPDTIRDRSVTVHMQRKTGAEPVERFRYRVANAEMESLRAEYAGWAAGAVDLLLAVDPDLPAQLDDRAAEAWEPLFAIADMAGGDWPTKSREAAIVLSGGEDRDEATTGTLLLSSIRKAFDEQDRITTAALLSIVNEDEELPFGGWREGKGLDGRTVAKLLKPYGVRPRTIKLEDGTTAKGYLREQFSEAWERWLTTTPDLSVTSVTAVTEPSPDLFSVTEKPHGIADVTEVTQVTALDDEGEAGDGPGPAVTATDDQEADIERVAEKFEVAT